MKKGRNGHNEVWRGSGKEHVAGENVLPDPEAALTTSSVQVARCGLVTRGVAVGTDAPSQSRLRVAQTQGQSALGH
jgi:hypothetical protein